MKHAIVTTCQRYWLQDVYLYLVLFRFSSFSLPCPPPPSLFRAMPPPCFPAKTTVRWTSSISSLYHSRSFLFNLRQLIIQHSLKGGSLAFNNGVFQCLISYRWLKGCFLQQHTIKHVLCVYKYRCAYWRELMFFFWAYSCLFVYKSLLLCFLFLDVHICTCIYVRVTLGLFYMYWSPCDGFMRPHVSMGHLRFVACISVWYTHRLPCVTLRYLVCLLYVPSR